MTIPPLTAAELFDIVKDCPEVWRDSEHTELWYNEDDKVFAWKKSYIYDGQAALILLALFTLAAECGVSYNDVTRRWYAVDVSGEVEDTGTDVHPLRAAVAAYKKKAQAARERGGEG
jgi:hypothetical protein